MSITKDTYEECVSEYLALKHGVMEAKKAPSRKSKTLKEAVAEYIDSRREQRSVGSDVLKHKSALVEVGIQHHHRPVPPLFSFREI